MNSIIKSSLTLCTSLFLICSSVKAVPYLHLATDNIQVDERISNMKKDEILNVVKVVIYEYSNYANFWDSAFGTFDDSKYANFISLFGGAAIIHNDLSKSPQAFYYSKYASQVFKYLQKCGVPFDLQNVRIKSLKIDDAGFYVADVDFEKVIYVALNKNNNIIQIPKGRTLKLNLKIDMPDYLISDARIQLIQLQTKKKPIDFLKSYRTKFQKSFGRISKLFGRNQ